jgi:DNA (cytosine-5)-methyltransferase 1
MNLRYAETLNQQEVSNLLDVSFSSINKMVKNGQICPVGQNKDGYVFSKESLLFFPIADEVFNSTWNEEESIKPNRKFTSIELFAGAGGMALGLEKSGFEHILLNEVDKWACKTLRENRPKWNVIEGDISKIDFTEFKNKVDLIAGGFPCQAFSYAGKKLGFEDTRGTLFFEFARSIIEAQPKMFIGENVKGLYSHDNGKTLKTIINTIKEIGYTLVEPKVLKAIYYKVPQKRERLFLIGIRNDLVNSNTKFQFPSPFYRVLTVKDALSKGVLYDKKVPSSEGDKYPKRKFEIMSVVPEGGYWKDLPVELQMEYMGGSFHLGGGKTGLARRLSLNSPSLTIVCAAAMKQTERCHPTETRPLTVRESARIQTFPDDWVFAGSKSHQYKQIGNAVPVNLAAAVGRSVVRYLNTLE